jgi:hypothetical protein
LFSVQKHLTFTGGRAIVYAYKEKALTKTAGTKNLQRADGR